MEADLLLWIHARASRPLDVAFVLSWVFGTWRFCISLVLLAVAWHLARRQRREALAWVAVGLAVALSTELLKVGFARPRPTLWPWLLPTTGYAFPSGHAVAAMAFYPFLGWLALRGRRLGRTGYMLGALFGVYVGLGRLYLGVHWPSDVLAGWAIGAALSGGAVLALTAPVGSSRVDRQGIR